MKSPPIDLFAQEMAEPRRQAIIKSAALTTGQRVTLLQQDYPDPDELRRLAGQIKQHTIDHLDTYLRQASEKLEENGVQVHFCQDADEARATALKIFQEKGVRKVVKSKSMVTEELHLNEFLKEHGIESLETDLGEFIIQIDEDWPSHIVRPIIHKKREEVAESFERHGLGDYNDDPETITRRARQHLRSRYMESDAGVTGANFVSADSGRLVLVTNEGNARFSMAPNRLHVAFVGIEKVIPRDQDLAVFLNLLARSATAQQLTVYTQFINGPRAQSQPSGPDEMHVIFLDNGRTEVLASNCQEILRCIRCGACQNVCPVYRQASGHAYRAVYGGPIGAVLTPLLASKKGQFTDFADLPKASSLCGACQEVCPVNIPIPELLLKLRNRAHETVGPVSGSPPMDAFADAAVSPKLWRTGLRAANAMNYIPDSAVFAGPLRAWLKQRTLPKWRGGAFRQWMKNRKQGENSK